MKPPLETSLAYKYFVAYRLYDGQRFDETVVPYRPHKSFEKRLRRVLRAQRKMFLFLAVVLSGIFIVTSSPLPLLVCLAACALTWWTLQAYMSVQPTHFGLSAKGVRQYWIRWFGDKSSPYIPWNKITRVRLRTAREPLQTELWVDLMTGDKAAASFRLEGINAGEHRKRVHTALRKFVSPEIIDRELNDLLNPIKVDGYTTLWLEVLSASTKRLRDDSLQAGSMLANERYTILKQLGVGGQGTAYLASPANESLPHEVVLKEFILPYHAGLTVSKKAFDSIQREADLLKKLDHPQVVKLIDLFIEDQRAYLVLEHIPGQSLRDLIKIEGPLYEARVVELALQMTDILKHLHGQSPPVVHRDFTPDNLILNNDGVVKLIDFNVAQQLEADATRTVVGKHSYISPEQFRGKAVPQSDIYALGATLHYLLTGSDPEPISAAHPRKVQDNISERLDAIIAKATEPLLSDRYTDADQLAADLRTI